MGDNQDCYLLYVPDTQEEDTATGSDVDTTQNAKTTVICDTQFPVSDMQEQESTSCDTTIETTETSFHRLRTQSFTVNFSIVKVIPSAK